MTGADIRGRSSEYSGLHEVPVLGNGMCHAAEMFFLLVYSGCIHFLQCVQYLAALTDLAGYHHIHSTVVNIFVTIVEHLIETHTLW